MRFQRRTSAPRGHRKPEAHFGLESSEHSGAVIHPCSAAGPFPLLTPLTHDAWPERISVVRPRFHWRWRGHAKYRSRHTDARVHACIVPVRRAAVRARRRCYPFQSMRRERVAVRANPSPPKAGAHGSTRVQLLPCGSHQSVCAGHLRSATPSSAQEPQPYQRPTSSR